MRNNHNTDEKSAAELLEEFEKKYNYRGSTEVKLIKIQNSDTGMQEQVTEETTAQDGVSFDASGVGISLNSAGVDPTTESICKEMEIQGLSRTKPINWLCPNKHTHQVKQRK